MENGTKRYVQTVEWLGRLYDFVNRQLFKGELKRPVITVQTDERNRAYGWFTCGKVWKESEEDDGQFEINMSAQFLNRPIEEITSTLIHETCHHFAKVNNLQDCSRGGSYHKRIFSLYDKNGKKREKLIPIEKYPDIPEFSGVEDKTFRKTVRGQSINERYLIKTRTRLNKWDMDRIRFGKYKKNKG